MAGARAIAIWTVLSGIILFALWEALTSPLLAWRDLIYIIAGLAGVIGLVLIVFQPLLAGGLLPGLSGFHGRRVHRWTGLALVAAVTLHVAGLWITSPPDVVDALTFTSPTPFSAWGVIAMWAVFGTAAIAVLRRRLRYRVWQKAHLALGAVIAAGTVAHALLIEGTMGSVSKLVLCAVALGVTAAVILRWARRRRMTGTS